MIDIHKTHTENDISGAKSIQDMGRKTGEENHRWSALQSFNTVCEQVINETIKLCVRGTE